MRARFLKIIWIVWAGLVLAACGVQPVPAVTPTAGPSLDAKFWMDYPTVQVGQVQSANLIVHDLAGQPVAGATALMVVNCGEYRREYYFQLTDTEGRARVSIEIPASEAGQIVQASVTVVDSAHNRWARSQTQFEILAETK